MSEKKSCKKRDLIISEIHELDINYKGLSKRKQEIMNELRRVDEELLKKMGAYQILKKILESFDKDALPNKEPKDVDN